MRSIRTPEDAEQAIADSADHPVLVYKHSTQCPISARAAGEVERFTRDSDVDVRQVLVIEDRPASLRLAERAEVTHESPQAILLRDGKAVWHASHGAITEDVLRKSTEKEERES